MSCLQVVNSFFPFDLFSLLTIMNILFLIQNLKTKLSNLLFDFIVMLCVSLLQKNRRTFITSHRDSLPDFRSAPYHNEFLRPLIKGIHFHLNSLKGSLQTRPRLKLIKFRPHGEMCNTSPHKCSLFISCHRVMTERVPVYLLQVEVGSVWGCHDSFIHYSYQINQPAAA